MGRRKGGERFIAYGRKHGSASTYLAHACRCDPCTTAASEYSLKMKRRRYEKAAAGLIEIPHGTVRGYASYGCRCDDCQLARNPSWLSPERVMARGREAAKDFGPITLPEVKPTRPWQIAAWLYVNSMESRSFVIGYAGGAPEKLPVMAARGRGMRSGLSTYDNIYPPVFLQKPPVFVRLTVDVDLVEIGMVESVDGIVSGDPDLVREALRKSTRPEFVNGKVVSTASS